MGLVNCPECGRANISDTAEQCPKCGYCVKEYFERENRKSFFEEQKQQIELKKEREFNKLKPELERKLNEIDDLPYPEKPTFLKSMFSGSGSGLTYATIIALIVLFLLGFVSIIFIVLFVLLLVLWTPFWILLSYGDYKSAMGWYEERTSDWDGYKKKLKEQAYNTYKEYAENMAVYGTRTVPMPKIQSNNTTSVPKCPTCGSTNISTISTTAKVAGAVTLGLLSKTAQSQFRCNNCGYNW